MALDDLAAVIDDLKSKIDRHGKSVSANETRTRQVLIDPLLRALGWDVSDPLQVELEFDVGKQKADYALLVDSKPVIVVEAKRLGRQLVDDDTVQVLNYANVAGIAHMVVTNGDEWRMYAVFKPGPIQDRVIVELRIAANPSHVSALQALSLWRSNLGSAEGPVAASAPVFMPGPGDDGRGPDGINEHPGQVDPGPGWTSLNQCSDVSGKMRPSKVKIGQAPEIKLSRAGWKPATVAIVKWLVDEGELTPEMCPVLMPGKRESVVTYGKQHLRAVELSNGIWVNTNKYAVDLLKIMRAALERCQVGESSVFLSFS